MEARLIFVSGVRCAEPRFCEGDPRRGTVRAGGRWCMRSQRADELERWPAAALFDQLQRHPEVMKAIEALAKLTAEKTGVNLQAGDKPSMAMMATLARYVASSSRAPLCAPGD